MSGLLIALLLVLVIGAIIVYMIPDPATKALAVKVLSVVIIVLLIGWVLQFFGVWSPHGAHGGLG